MVTFVASATLAAAGARRAGIPGVGPMRGGGTRGRSVGVPQMPEPLA